jgi:hypothetical protein
MKQCYLEKDGPYPQIYTTSWIPAVFAEVGRPLEMRNAKGIWENWTVVDVYRFPLEYNYVRERSQDYKKLPSTKVKMK